MINISSITKQNLRGFTLVEILVVIGIIGMLSMASLALVKTVAKNKNIKSLSDLTKIKLIEVRSDALNPSEKNSGLTSIEIRVYKTGDKKIVAHYNAAASKDVTLVDRIADEIELKTKNLTNTSSYDSFSFSAGNPLTVGKTNVPDPQICFESTVGAGNYVITVVQETGATEVKAYTNPSQGCQ